MLPNKSYLPPLRLCSCGLPSHSKPTTTKTTTATTAAAEKNNNGMARWRLGRILQNEVARAVLIAFYAIFILPEETMPARGRLQSLHRSFLTTTQVAPLCQVAARPTQISQALARYSHSYWSLLRISIQRSRLLLVPHQQSRIPTMA